MINEQTQTAKQKLYTCKIVTDLPIIPPSITIIPPTPTQKGKTAPEKTP